MNFFFFFFFILRHYCSIEIDDGNSKHDDDDVDDDGTATKDSDSKPIDLKDTEFDRPSSSGKYQAKFSSMKEFKWRVTFG